MYVPLLQRAQSRRESKKKQDGSPPRRENIQSGGPHHDNVGAAALLQHRYFLQKVFSYPLCGTNDLHTSMSWLGNCAHMLAIKTAAQASRSSACREQHVRSPSYSTGRHLYETPRKAARKATMLQKQVLALCISGTTQKLLAFLPYTRPGPRQIFTATETLSLTSQRWAPRTFFTATACSHHVQRNTRPYAPEPSSHSLPSGRRQMVISSGAMAHVSVASTRGSPPPLSRLLSRLLRVLARSGPLPAGSCRQACRRDRVTLRP